MVKNQVTVKGVVDSQSLCSRIRKRTQRKVQVFSQPTAEAEGDSKPEVVPPQVDEIQDRDEMMGSSIDWRM